MASEGGGREGGGVHGHLVIPIRCWEGSRPGESGESLGNEDTMNPSLNTSITRRTEEKELEVQVDQIEFSARPGKSEV